MTVYVFIGSFQTDQEARSYSFGYWEPEPDENSTDDVYNAWESRNPIWPLRQELGLSLEPAFMEIIRNDPFKYLKGIIARENDYDIIQQKSRNRAIRWF